MNRRLLARLFSSFAVLCVMAGCGPQGDDSEAGKPESDGKMVNGKADAWNYTNNPSRFQMQFDYSYNGLSQYTVGRAEQTPWPSDYWSYYEDSTNVRFHGDDVLSPMEKYDNAFNGWDPNMSLTPLQLNGCDKKASTGSGEEYYMLSDTHNEYYEHLGPAAKWQHENKGIYPVRNGFDDDGDGKTDECDGDYDGIETWWGLCHAWVPAAILEPEPLHPVTYNGVEFTISDLKALLITMYDKSSALMLGGRCNEKEFERDKYGRLTRDDCRDTNAGSFHVIITNLLGKQKRAFAEDRTAGYQVWNQPILGYQIYEQRELGEKEALSMLGVTAAQVAAKLGISEQEAAARLENPSGLYGKLFDSPEAVKFAFVKMSTDYITESSNTEDLPLTPMIGRYTRSDNYTYILELKQNGDIVGGEWINYSRETHPDFLWLPMPGRNGGNPFIKMEHVRLLIEKSRQTEQPGGGSEMELRTFESSGQVAIPDNNPAGVSSAIEVAENIAIGTLKVKLSIQHTYIGDLVVTLEHAGTKTILHDRTGGGTANIDKDADVTEFNSMSAAGLWELRIHDQAAQDEGKLLGWSLLISPGQAGGSTEINTLTAEAAPSLDIPDNNAQGVSSTLSVAGEGSVQAVEVTINVTHPYIGDLILTLNHNGSEQLLHSREGGSSDNIVKTYQLDGFRCMPAQGTWVLKVSDNDRLDKGKLNNWSLKIKVSR